MIEPVEDNVVPELEREPERKAFITGSRAYGTPTEDSDVDLVVLVDYETLDKLVELAPDLPEFRNLDHYDHRSVEGASLKFGKLNIIAIAREELFDCWCKGTNDLILKKPVTRDEAIAHLRSLREKL